MGPECGARRNQLRLDKDQSISIIEAAGVDIVAPPPPAATAAEIALPPPPVEYAYRMVVGVIAGGGHRVRREPNRASGLVPSRTQRTGLPVCNKHGVGGGGGGEAGGGEGGMLYGL